MTDAIVIGAGPNGLVAANVLADAGWDVLVLEANDEVGGAVRSAELVEPGFTSDLFSAFYPLAVASPAIRALRLEEHGLRWCRSALACAHPTPGGPTRRSRPTTSTPPPRPRGLRGRRRRRMARAVRPLGGGRGPALGRAADAVPAAARGRAAGRPPGPLGLLPFLRFGVLPVRRLGEEEFGARAARCCWPATRCTPTSRRSPPAAACSAGCSHRWPSRWASPCRRAARGADRGAGAAAGGARRAHRVRRAGRARGRARRARRGRADGGRRRAARRARGARRRGGARAVPRAGRRGAAAGRPARRPAPVPVGHRHGEGRLDAGRPDPVGGRAGGAGRDRARRAGHGRALRTRSRSRSARCPTGRSSCSASTQPPTRTRSPAGKEAAWAYTHVPQRDARATPAATASPARGTSRVQRVRRPRRGAGRALRARASRPHPRPPRLDPAEAAARPTPTSSAARSTAAPPRSTSSSCSGRSPASVGPRRRCRACTSPPPRPIPAAACTAPLGANAARAALAPAPRLRRALAARLAR